MRARVEQWVAQRLTLTQVAFGHLARDGAEPAQVGRALGDTDRAAGVEHIEQVRALQTVVVGRQDQVVAQKAPRLRLVCLEQTRVDGGIGNVEVEPGELDLGLVMDLPVRHAGGPGELVDRLHVAEIHRDALEPVGDLGRDRSEIDPSCLLEVRELGDLHAVEPHLPAQTPGAQGGRLPVVLDEADVVTERIDAKGLQAPQIQLLDAIRRGLEDHLELVVALDAIRVLTVPSVSGAARGLDVGHLPRFRTKDAQEGVGVHRPGPDFHVVGLLDHAAQICPVPLEREQQILERHRAGSPVSLPTSSRNRVARDGRPPRYVT